MMHVVAVAVVACQNIARKPSAICQQTAPAMQIGATAREAHQRATCKCNKPLQGAIDATEPRLTVVYGIALAMEQWSSEAV